VELLLIYTLRQRSVKEGSQSVAEVTLVKGNEWKAIKQKLD
jgi:hypothetical protein